MDLLDIRRRIEAGDNADQIRTDLGEKIMECLVARGETLGPWERVHFGIAIDLLPSPWLRHTWTHVDSVCNPASASTDRSQPRQVEHPPELQDLMNKLIAAMAEIHEHQSGADSLKP